MRKISLDELPTSGFHKRVAFVAAGGPFCDGYLLGIVVAALPLIAQDLALSAIQSGMIGASTLLGMFLGGLIFGPITDKYGRHKTYVINLLVFVVCSAAHLFVRDTTLLIVLRLIMGVAIGADYPIATALATELLPRKLRGPVLSSFILCFWLGYCISISIGIFSSVVAIAGAISSQARRYHQWPSSSSVQRFLSRHAGCSSLASAQRLRAS
ncbi:MFS transporter [Burkholderia anthina]|uniref:MFS transporter n=1 Tax=Burkholderia anthina TaxID=179879 RepID=UPI0024425EF0|nr:MFS transporter [Burkholderia anthina]